MSCEFCYLSKNRKVITKPKVYDTFYEAENAALNSENATYMYYHQGARFTRILENYKDGGRTIHEWPIVDAEEGEKKE